MHKYFNDLQSGIEKKISENPDNYNSRKKYALEIARLGKELYSKDNKIAWCGPVAPFDLLRAHGITSCFVEFIGATLASMGDVAGFLEESEKTGFSTDSCGFHRSIIGAVMKGIMPEPEFLIGTTCPCSGGVSIMERLAKIFNKDLFLLHVPQYLTDENTQYLAGQLRDMMDFISSHTGNPLDKDRLRIIIEKANKTRDLTVELFKLAQRVPSPTNGRDMKNLGLVLPLFWGTDRATELIQSFVNEFSQRIESSKELENEKARLMWIQNRIQFNHPLEKALKYEYGAIIVVDELNDIWWDPIDPDDPYTGIAKRIIGSPLNGETNNRIDHLKALAKSYKIDGAINPCHWGCRQGTGARGLVEDGLKTIDVPVLNLEVDCVDNRNFAEGQLRTRIEAFIEMLENKPSPWEV